MTEPLSRVMPCPDCAPHEWHHLTCECGCPAPPTPGVYPTDT